MRVLISDLGLVELPRWHDKRLWFAEWIAGQVIAVDTDGRSAVMIHHQSLPVVFRRPPGRRSPGRAGTGQSTPATCGGPNRW